MNKMIKKFLFFFLWLRFLSAPLNIRSLAASCSEKSLLVLLPAKVKVLTTGKVIKQSG